MFPSAAHQHLVLRVMQPYNWISVITVSVCSGNFYKDHSSWKGGTCASIFLFKFYARFQRRLNGRSNLFTILYLSSTVSSKYSTEIISAQFSFNICILNP